MAFVAHVSWTGPATLDTAVTACLRQHSSKRPDPQILQPGTHSAAAWVEPSRARHFDGGVSILLSGRPTIPRIHSTESEIEAIHRLYRAQGAACFEHISGSFAIVILDPEGGRCLFARDRLGFVPLFYRIDRDGVWVGDSIKPILASRCVYFTLDHEAIYRYLYIKAFESPDTVVKEIKSVRPGVFFDVTPTDAREKLYWDVPVSAANEGELAGATGDLAALLSDAISRGLGDSTDPVGILISGGLDSGVLACLAAKQDIADKVGINVAFESKWSEIDESCHAQAVADACGIPLRKVEFTQDRLAQSLPALWWNNPLPTANSGFKLNLIGSQLQQGAGTPGTYMLGEGADTLLSFGWNWKYFDRLHRIGRLTELLPADVRRGAAGALERLLQGVQTSRLSNDVTGILRGYLAANLGYLKWKGSVIRPETIDKLFAPGLRDRVGFKLLSRVFGVYPDSTPAAGFSEKLIYVALKSYVPNQQLMNYHTACNYFGAELACPFLDEQVLDFSLKLSWQQRDQKRILKELAERWIPQDVVHRQKCAFLMPMSEWIKTHFWPLIEIVFSRETLERRGLFDPDGMAALKRSFAAGESASWPDIWTFVVLEAWLRINLDVDSPACPDSIEAVFPELEGLRKPQRRSA